jgi:dihydrodipicolinate synthase/N-acetylneuraminate lyase
MFRGVFPPTVTLFRQDGSLDTEGNARLCDTLIESGVHGLFILGTTGEFMHLAAREREQHATETVQHVNGRVPVIVGTGTTSTAETVRLSRHAEGVGADAVAVITPYFWTLSEKEIIAHVSAVANAVDIAVVVYNFPAYSGVNITSETLAALVKEHSNIAGVKDSLDDLEHLRRRVAVVKSLKSDFSVLTGADGLLLAALEIGCDGAVPATANIAPRRHVAVWEAHNAGEHARAIADMLTVNRLLDLYRITGSFHSVVKEAMGQLGLTDNPTARQPALPLSAESRAKVRETLERAGLAAAAQQDPAE